MKKCTARILDQSSTAPASEVLKFTRQFTANETGNAYVLGMLSRTSAGPWLWELVDKSYTLLEAGTYRMLEPQLQQLCLIIADGMFHEKEALRRQMREMGSRRGLLVAFIVLDNPETSVLDMQSVTFASGKPVFQKYMDTFPFPYYTLVQDINRLPSVISDLLRQWFEITAV